MNHQELLFEFLRMPLDSADAVLERFAALPGAVFRKGNKPLQRYVCIPGTRKDRVVLMAHADTVWDKCYSRPHSGPHEVLLEDGVFKGTGETWGIGSDCRAGCAMLWALKDSGHTILLLDGEEHGKWGANYLKKADKKLFRQLNRHCFMIEFDWQGTDCALFNQADNTKAFKAYIEKDLGFLDSKKGGGCDLGVLCRRVCGVNLGVGFHGWHKAGETLVLSEWENTFRKAEAFLQQPQKRYKSRFLPFYIRLCKRGVKKFLRMLGWKKQPQKTK